MRAEVTERDRSERVRLREMFRDESEFEGERERERERERESYYFNQPVIKIIIFFFLLS